MCGIGAIYGKKIKEKEFSIKRSLQLIEHRGYSLYETKVLDNCVLGCNRLEIVDRPKAIQPQTNEDESVFVVLNGEIFNYKELRAKLSEKGHKFKTNSDTEVLVHLWEEYGENMLKELDSEMFTFFIYDKNKDTFFVARDPYGIKPLYYAIDKFENYHFASEIKQLSQFKEIDEVFFFPQGHYMINRKLKKYHNLPKPSEKLKKPLQEIITNLRNLFDEAVKKRVDTDLPIGVFFSGGIDSTAILKTAIKYHNDVTAIVVGHHHAPDVLIAKKYCEENKIKLIHFNPPTEKELFKLIPEIVNITESFEPNMIRQSAVSYYISKIARDKGFKIILCGEGPDEVFAGYPEFKNCKSELEISKKINDFISNLPRTQFQRVDRTSMHFTLEVRVPFFDTKLVDYSIKIPSKYKIKTIEKEKVTKWILREAMKDRLPDYIVNRQKVVLSEGAGFKGNQLIGGLFFDLVKGNISNEEFRKIKKDYPDWNINNKEVAYYFKIYAKNLFVKAKFNKDRPLVNAIDSIKDEKSEFLTEKILDSIHTNKLFKDSPYKEDELKTNILDSVKNNTIIQIVGYWGIEKEQPDRAEIIVLDSLKQIEEKIKEHHKKVEIILILTDIHGSLNLIDNKTIKNYFSKIKVLAKNYEFKTLFLSDLWKKNKWDLSMVESELKEKPKIWWQHFPIKKQLLESAKKHHKGRDIEIGAKKYALTSKYDSEFVEKEFSKSIFFTYNSKSWQKTLPNIPTIYLYGVGKNKSLKPWHLKMEK